MCRPVRFVKLLSQLDFSWRWLWVAEMTARSSAKSRSSKHENKGHWIPQGRSDVVLRITQSITTRNKIGERMQPCLTPDLTGNDFQSILHNDTTFKVFIECSYNGNNFVPYFYSVFPQDLAEAMAMNIIKCFLEVNEVNIQGNIPFNALLYSVWCSEEQKFDLCSLNLSEPLPVPLSACKHLRHNRSSRGGLCRRPCWGWTEVLCLASYRSCWGRSPIFRILNTRPLLQSGDGFVVPDLSKEISKHHGGCDDICLE